MTFMVAAAIGAGGALLGGVISSRSASRAANTQAAAATQAADTQSAAALEAARIQAQSADKALQLQRDQWNQTQTNQQPWLNAGTNALTQMQYGQYSNPTPWKDFSMSDYQQDPGYQFRLSEGLKALDRTAAARGGLLSGATLKGAQRYGQDLASQEYNAAYGRYNTDQANRIGQENTGYNRLAALAGVGQTANSQLNAAGQNFANAGSNIYGNLGSATAAGINAAGTAGAAGINAAGQSYAAGQLGTGNSWANALNSGVSSYGQYNLLNALKSSPAPVVSSGWGDTYAYGRE
jgi:hypothetical protein